MCLIVGLKKRKEEGEESHDSRQLCLHNDLFTSTPTLWTSDHPSWLAGKRKKIKRSAAAGGWPGSKRRRRKKKTTERKTRFINAFKKGVNSERGEKGTPPLSLPSSLCPAHRLEGPINKLARPVLCVIYRAPGRRSGHPAKEEKKILFLKKKISIFVTGAAEDHPSGGGGAGKYYLASGLGRHVYM